MHYEDQELIDAVNKVADRMCDELDRLDDAGRQVDFIAYYTGVLSYIGHSVGRGIDTNHIKTGSMPKLKDVLIAALSDGFNEGLSKNTTVTTQH